MRFNFLAFIEQLRENPEKKKVVEEYEELYGPITGDVTDQLWYTEYLSLFESYQYKLPHDIEEEYDRDLLTKLIVGSFSSDCVLEKIEGEELRDLVVSVKSGDQSVVKKISELLPFQLERLYEIYVEEEMNLHILMKKEENERAAIVAQREARVQRRKLMLESLGNEERAAQAKAQQQGQLNDLYSQL